MTYTSPALPVPPMCSWLTMPTAPQMLSSFAKSSGAWEAADRAIYYSLVLPAPCTLKRFWWVNGDTVDAGYLIDAGIYSDGGYKPGARLISTGQTAQGTANQVQFVDVTDMALAPGLYWLAFSITNATSTIWRAVASSSYDPAFKYAQASANPLPATATPIESITARFYIYGFATTASP